MIAIISVVADTTKVRIFKQITTGALWTRYYWCCCWYHKGTNFQANHNCSVNVTLWNKLLLIPQRYEFSSKSQPSSVVCTVKIGCCWYHKGTNFQANHNKVRKLNSTPLVVADTTKVRIFKQITTSQLGANAANALLLIPQRYEFSSKSQQTGSYGGKEFVVADTTKVRIFKQITTRQKKTNSLASCCWYHKGTNFQANHNIG